MVNSNRFEFAELFPSPLLKCLWPNSDNLNEQLAELILCKEKEDRGISTTNVGGWHSKKNLQDWDGECVKAILSRMLILGQEMVKRVFGSAEPEFLSNWTIQAWANINRYGHYNKFHNHIRNLNLWSGVYYVQTGVTEADAIASASLIFADQHRVEPRGRKEFKKRYVIQPEPGLMLLFPSSLGHCVEPHHGTGDRVTIAFNLKNDRFTTINYEIENHSAGKS